eukprot:scaffold22078_cov33-Tisochrysis_lutea.AAC.1
MLQTALDLIAHTGVSLSPIARPEAIPLTRRIDIRSCARIPWAINGVRALARAWTDGRARREPGMRVGGSGRRGAHPTAGAAGWPSTRW